jgi:hypothetical protein
MRRQEVVAGEVIHIGRFRVVPIVRVVVTSDGQRNAAMCSASLVPEGVVVRGGDETYALDLEGRPIPIPEEWSEVISDAMTG